METRAAARAALVALLAIAYASLAWYAAGTGASGVLPPLSRAVTIAVPLATGVIASCAVTSSTGVFVMLASWLPVALAGAVAVSAGWLPLAWFASAGARLAGASLAGGLAGRLVAADRRRVGFAAVAALLPVLLARYEPAVPTSAVAQTATITMRVQAPAAEVWQELIRPGAQVDAWDEGEHLQVADTLPPMIVPRGLAAWRARGTPPAVVSTFAAFDLAPSGDAAATLTMRRTYRMPIHAAAYPASVLAEAANARAVAELRELQEQSVARARGVPPRLTGEMRVLRDSAVRAVQAEYARRGELPGQAVLFINGVRAVELPDALPAPAPLDAPRAVHSSRALLHTAANRARTTAWMHTGHGDDAASAPSRGDSLRFEFEDFEGRCVAEVTPVVFSRDRLSFLLGTPQRSRCAQSVMEDRTRRSRLLARLPLAAGRLEDAWSVALTATGSVRVYRDSVVIRADTLRLKAKPLDGAAQRVDSLVAGLSLGGDRSWSVQRRSAAVRLDTTLADQREWMRTRQRFTIPLDSLFLLEQSWPTFEVILRTPRTADNPYGVAWTYAHAPMGFFREVRR